MSVRLLLTGQAKLFIASVRKYLYINMYNVCSVPCTWLYDYMEHKLQSCIFSIFQTIAKSHTTDMQYWFKQQTVPIAMYRSVLDSSRVDMEIRNIYLFDHLSLVWSLSVLTCINAVNNKAEGNYFCWGCFPLSAPTPTFITVQIKCQCTTLSSRCCTSPK